MNVQQLIAALHEAAGGDNSFYDAEVIIRTRIDTSIVGDALYERRDIDEVMSAHTDPKGKTVIELGHS